MINTDKKLFTRIYEIIKSRVGNLIDDNSDFDPSNLLSNKCSTKTEWLADQITTSLQIDKQLKSKR